MGKTPEEIKKGLNYCSEDGCKGCNYKEDCDMADGFSVLAFDALALIQQLEDHFREVTKMVPKWISVEDKLPDDDDDVLVYDRLDGIGVCQYSSVLRKFFGDAEGTYIEVTHWMPLPERPKEG